jgi:hypothetical protein
MDRADEAGSEGAMDVGDASVEATSSEAGSDADQAAACTGTASCASGQVCCVINELTSSTACQVVSCPYQPGFGPLQLVPR